MIQKIFFVNSDFYVLKGKKKSEWSKLKTPLVSWCAKIQPKLNEIQKTFRKQGFFDNFSSILAES